MPTVEELKREADDAQRKITEIVKECKEEEGSNLGWALGSSLATELGFYLSDASKTPKNVWAQLGNGIVHGWRFVTHSDTIREVSKALQPSCETQLKNAIKDMEDAKKRWEEKKMEVQEMKKEHEKYMENRKKLQFDFWNNYKGSLDKYEKQKKVTESAYKAYAWACGKVTIYEAPKARVYDKAGFEKIWGNGRDEFRKFLKG